MIFKSIRLKEGFFERAIIFSEGVNLIHSEKNSCGKTTLLRFMLYALGYNIPNTRKIKFDRCEVELVIECETVGEILLLRHSDIAIEATVKDQKRTFVLPEQQNDLHTIIFGTENVDILGNLLGAFYVDQEKGWTLLNRGVVIGSIHFKIEELIRGLSDCDCSELIRKEAQLSREMTKYKQMFSVAQYRETLDQEAGELVTDSYEEESDVTVNQLLLRKKRLKSELRRIDNTLSDNRRFKKFVADMKLLVQAPDVIGITQQEDEQLSAAETWPLVASSLSYSGTLGPYWYFVRKTVDLGQLESYINRAAKYAGKTLKNGIKEFKPYIEKMRKEIPLSKNEKQIAVLLSEYEKSGEKKKRLIDLSEKYIGKEKQLCQEAQDDLQKLMEEELHVGDLLIKLVENVYSFQTEESQKYWARTLCECATELEDARGLYAVISETNFSSAYTAVRKAFRIIDFINYGPKLE